MSALVIPTVGYIERLDQLKRTKEAENKKKSSRRSPRQSGRWFTGLRTQPVATIVAVPRTLLPLRPEVPKER